jgi:hypothetical protein
MMLLLVVIAGDDFAVPAAVINVIFTAAHNFTVPADIIHDIDIIAAGDNFFLFLFLQRQLVHVFVTCYCY